MRMCLIELEALSFVIRVDSSSLWRKKLGARDAYTSRALSLVIVTVAVGCYDGGGVGIIYLNEC